MASQVAQWQRTWLPTQEMQETWASPLGPEDPLEKEMAIYPRILAWKFHGLGGPDEPQSRGSEESDMIEQADHTHTQFIYSPQISTCIIFIFEQDNIHLLVLALLLSTSFLFVTHFMSCFCIFSAFCWWLTVQDD